MSSNTMTMADHAKAWGRKQGLQVPEHGSPEWREFYDAWHKFAFADFAPARPFFYMLSTYRRSSKRNEMTLKERQKFGPMACEWLASLPGAIRDQSYDFKVDTIYGPLAISAYDHSIMCRFADEELAMPCTMSRTGKWNHYYFDVSNSRITAQQLLDYFAGRLVPILKQKPSPVAWEYHVNLDERGEFYADVRGGGGKTVFEIVGFEIFEDGFMRHKADMAGLTEHLRSLRIIGQDDRIIAA